VQYKMPRYTQDDYDAIEEDTTAALPVKSKRTERIRAKRARKQDQQHVSASLGTLPTELVLEVLELLEPSDVFCFSRASRRFLELVRANSDSIGETILQRRYSILARCLPVPRRLCEVNPAAVREALADRTRQTQLGIHNRYQHIQPVDGSKVCSCITCVMLWNNLGLALDFAHWQGHLDKGVPIETVPRGQVISWNSTLVGRNARIAYRAVEDSLWHARVLQAHLDSTVRSIRRHARNKGNRRTHVDMTAEEAASGRDGFLTKAGPPSLEFPYQRDEYYMLEAYLPNRWWRKTEQRWVYTVGGQHERDVEQLVQRLGGTTDA
jgi:hypothetical protein